MTDDSAYMAGTTTNIQYGRNANSTCSNILYKAAQLSADSDSYLQQTLAAPAMHAAGPSIVVHYEPCLHCSRAQTACQRERRIQSITQSVVSPHAKQRSARARGCVCSAHPGGQRKRYKDQLRVNLKPAILTIQNWKLWRRIGPSGGERATAQ